MNNLQTHINNYLEHCRHQKRLDSKTLKAYRIDLQQFYAIFSCRDVSDITPDLLENYIGSLHQKYKPKTVKRKIASVKALFHYLEYKEIIARNPFNKVQIKFREPVILPKTIPLHTIEIFLSTIYEQRTVAKTDYQRKNALRNAAVIELLFATGIRISELCALRICDIDLYDGSVLIYGKGSKERIVQIGNHEVIQILSEYRNEFLPQMETCQHFFATLNGTALSDQSVRRMINKYASLAAIEQHITPHMFRHTFCHQPFRSGR